MRQWRRADLNRAVQSHTKSQYEGSQQERDMYMNIGRAKGERKKPYMLLDEFQHPRLDGTI